MNLNDLNWRDFHTIALDFDEAFPIIKLVNEQGLETVNVMGWCGLGFDLLRKFVLHENDLEYFVISKERNPVVLKDGKNLILFVITA